MRAFISVNLSEEIKRNLASIQQTLGERSRFIRWIAPQNCHLTLKFLGDITAAQEAEIKRVLEPVACTMQPFSVSIGGLGAFPPRGVPSVVWIGVTEGEEALQSLESRIFHALKEGGIPFDSKRFTPHITIGRAQRNGKPLLQYNRAEPLAAGELAVQSFYLMESRLDSSGAVYSERACFSPGGVIT